MAEADETRKRLVGNAVIGALDAVGAAIDNVRHDAKNEELIHYALFFDINFSTSKECEIPEGRAKHKVKDVHRMSKAAVLEKELCMRCILASFKKTLTEMEAINTLNVFNKEFWDDGNNVDNVLFDMSSDGDDVKQMIDTLNVFKPMFNHNV